MVDGDEVLIRTSKKDKSVTMYQMPNSAIGDEIDEENFSLTSSRIGEENFPKGTGKAGSQRGQGVNGPLRVRAAPATFLIIFG